MLFNGTATILYQYKKFLSGTFLSFIRIMYFHSLDKISGGIRGPVIQHVCILYILKKIISIKTYSPMHKKIVSTWVVPKVRRQSPPYIFQ